MPRNRTVESSFGQRPTGAESQRKPKVLLGAFPPLARRSDVRLTPDAKRVLTLPAFTAGSVPRIQRVLSHLLSLDSEQVESLLADVERRFAHRHHDLRSTFLKHLELLSPRLPHEQELPESLRLLIGAHFTHEYSLEAAALFNPSIVPHPDQSGLDAGALRFVMSLRAVGEGHISSLAFTTGVIAENLDITFSDRGSKVVGPERVSLGEREVVFSPTQPLSGRAIFPQFEDSRAGIEDARFVRFHDDEAIAATYYATYTAYDGRDFGPALIETSDFLRFRFVGLSGAGVENKGMALFPRRIDGRYAMLSRQDNERLFLMYSDSIDRWDDRRVLRTPTLPWEFLQIGNCGSPIELPEGWLVLTHGVGAMRRYCIGAILLDLNDPSRVIGVLEEPLLEPNEEEREGYVPNVLYTCGALVHRGALVLPYAMSDRAIKVALVDVQDLLNHIG